MKRPGRLVAVVLAFGVGGAARAQAAFDAFAKFDDIKGESNDSKRPDEIGVLSFS